jgi:hypothetical protein
LLQVSNCCLVWKEFCIVCAYLTVFSTQDRGGKKLREKDLHILCCILNLNENWGYCSKKGKTIKVRRISSVLTMPQFRKVKCDGM